RRVSFNAGWADGLGFVPIGSILGGSTTGNVALPKLDDLNESYSALIAVMSSKAASPLNRRSSSGRSSLLHASIRAKSPPSAIRNMTDANASQIALESRDSENLKGLAGSERTKRVFSSITQPHTGTSYSSEVPSNVSSTRSAEHTSNRNSFRACS